MRNFALVITVVAVFFACSVERPSPEETVRSSYLAMENEDIEAYLETVTGPRAAVAGTLLVSFFDEFDVAYSIDTIELLGEIGDVAQVRTVVTATDRSGTGNFRDNRMEAIHKLRFERGKWRIYFSEVGEPVFLGRPVADAVSPKN
ncbi:MAG TPA: hypothetical protein ENN07_04505 [candidate division Zixibacteria bacterium]|nr:hypothetical protein [candidate division Zixibacteria bacterium]